MNPMYISKQLFPFPKFAGWIIFPKNNVSSFLVFYIFSFLIISFHILLFSADNRKFSKITERINLCALSNVNLCIFIPKNIIRNNIGFHLLSYFLMSLQNPTFSNEPCLREIRNNLESMTSFSFILYNSTYFLSAVY